MVHYWVHTRACYWVEQMAYLMVHCSVYYLGWSLELHYPGEMVELRVLHLALNLYLVVMKAKKCLIPNWGVCFYL